MTRKEFQKKLDALKASLKRQPFTANSLAAMFHTSRAAILRRLAALDVRVKTKLVRQGERGPAARAFYIP